MICRSISMKENRLTTRLTDYWNRLRKDNILPQWEQFNTVAFQDLWKSCCKWRVEPGQSESIVYTYEYVGSAVKEALGADPTGTVFTGQLRGFAGAQIVHNIDKVAKNPMPLMDEGRFINDKSKIVKYRSCMLPFGTKKGKITHIVLGLSWKEG